MVYSSWGHKESDMTELLNSITHVFYVSLFIVLSVGHVLLFRTPWNAACQASLSFTVSQSLCKLMSIESVMLSNHLILCCPLLPSIFSSKPAPCIRELKYWNFSFSISPSNEYSGLISFNIDWFDLLQSKGLLRSSPAPQFKSINPLALSLLYSSTLTSIHDYWKNHSFDYMHLCW